MRAVSLDRLRERMELARIGHETATSEFHQALDAALNGRVAKAKRRGRPKGSKNRPKAAGSAASTTTGTSTTRSSKHPWRAKKILGDKPSNPATEATE